MSDLLRDGPASTLQILGCQFDSETITVTFVDTTREHRDVSEIRNLILGRTNERFAPQVADVLDTLRQLVVDAEDERRGTPLTRRG